MKWYHSMVFRVMLLCGVLLACLFASVFILSRHYATQVSREMERETQTLADSLVFQLEDNSDRDLTALEKDLKQQFEQYDEISVRPYAENETPQGFTVEIAPDGRVTRVARLRISHEGRQLLLTARLSWSPVQNTIRVFKNKYLLMVTMVFLVALGSMVYFIFRILRPLTDLTRSCSEVSDGKLITVATDHRNTREILALEETFNHMVTSLREKDIVEANLRKAQRLSAIGNLAAGVAHDVRNPLNAIKLLSSHAIDQIESGGNAQEASRHLETIRNEVHRLEEIVSGFLSLARERELQPEPSRMDSILNECVNLIRKDAEERGIRLLTDLRAGDTMLMIDPKQWMRAILNVLINAMDACPEGRRVRLFSRATDRTCEIEIRDDGPGMDAETLEHAFDPYFTTKTTGTGLGLSITRGIIEEHGGTIDITSRAGEGCQVLITIPIQGAGKA